MERLGTIERQLVRWLAHFTGGGASRNTFLVLHYHRVAPVVDPLFPDFLDPATFEAHLNLLADAFCPLPLAEALQRQQNNSLPTRAVCVTFDDGYADNHDVALPILRRLGICATFYIATGYLRGGNMFNDTLIEALRVAPAELDLDDLGLGQHTLRTLAERRAAIDRIVEAVKYRAPRERVEVAAAVYARCARGPETALMMNEAQVRALVAAGMEVGAHTVTHPILLRLDDADAEREIAQSRADLEAIVGERVTSFAFPNGKPGADYGSQHARAARKAGFLNAFTTSWGCVHEHSDPWQLPRIAPWDRDALRFGARVALAYRERSPAVAL